jgi:hypothetical protein
LLFLPQLCPDLDRPPELQMPYATRQYLLMPMTKNKHWRLLPRTALTLGIALMPWTLTNATEPSVGDADVRMEQLCLRIEQGDESAVKDALDIIGQLELGKNPDRRLLRRNMARLVYASLTSLPSGPRNEAFAAIEKIEQSLRVSYPEQGESDEALVHLAENHTVKADAVRIAQDLVSRMSTPNQVRCRALAILQRYNLIGRKFQEVWPETVYVKGISKLNPSRIVIYSWKSGDDSTLASLRSMLNKYPKNTHFIGINLEDDIKKAPSRAKKLNLPGAQITQGADLVSTRLGIAIENVVIQTDSEVVPVRWTVGSEN